VRIFVADAPSGDWSELTDGDQRTVRVAASDLQQARRARTRIRAGGDDVAVILDITVAVAGDFRSARSVLGLADHTVHYAGTVDGLAGLISDISRADVADGVTLIPAAPRQDLRTVGHDVLRRLASRDQPRAS
jgi:alkanesulfonate monooxygenase SsuD/methylene tetrahydromethanopterin reductase-like flavin-dependent oxidoreductase (luciferase family)